MYGMLRAFFLDVSIIYNKTMTFGIKFYIKIRIDKRYAIQIGFRESTFSFVFLYFLSS